MVSIFWSEGYGWIQSPGYHVRKSRDLWGEKELRCSSLPYNRVVRERHRHQFSRALNSKNVPKGAHFCVQEFWLMGGGCRRPPLRVLSETALVVVQSRVKPPEVHCACL